MILWVKDDGEVTVSVANKAEAKRVITTCGDMTIKEIFQKYTTIK